MISDDNKRPVTGNISRRRARRRVISPGWRLTSLQVARPALWHNATWHKIQNSGIDTVTRLTIWSVVEDVA